MNKLAVCIIAYNEDQNIAYLIDKIIKEDFKAFTLFIYTDGSTDRTADIVAFYKSKYPDLIFHLKGNRRKGKNYAFNILLTKVRRCEIAIFLDADINPQEKSLLNLYEHLVSHKNLNAVSPLFLAYTKGLSGLEKTISDLNSKARIHAAKYKRYKFLSGRMYCIRTDILARIPPESYSDDFYLNLLIPFGSIDICEDVVVYYRRPSNIKDFISYNVRLGKSIASIRICSEDLWKDQNRRLSLLDYAVFDLTRYKFGVFFSKLNTFEMVVFIFCRLLSFISMTWGYLSYKPTPGTYRIDSTKITYAK